MRIVIVGASMAAVMAARSLNQSGHDVIIIESNRDSIKELEGDLDCSFLCGDGGKPSVLREVDPKATDVLFCLTDDDHANIISSLVGRSLGFKKVVTSITDSDYEVICRELGLENVIVPARTISRHLENIVHGLDSVELSTLLKDQARFFTFTAQKDDEDSINEIDLPKKSQIIYYYRDGLFNFVDSKTKIRQGDEVVILAHTDALPELKKRWEPYLEN